MPPKEGVPKGRREQSQSHDPHERYPPQGYGQAPNPSPYEQPPQAYTGYQGLPQDPRGQSGPQSFFGSLQRQSGYGPAPEDILEQAQLRSTSNRILPEPQGLYHQERLSAPRPGPQPAYGPPHPQGYQPRPDLAQADPERYQQTHAPASSQSVSSSRMTLNTQITDLDHGRAHPPDGYLLRAKFQDRGDDVLLKSEQTFVYERVNKNTMPLADVAEEFTKLPNRAKRIYEKDDIYTIADYMKRQLTKETNNLEEDDHWIQVAKGPWERYPRVNTTGKMTRPTHTPEQSGEIILNLKLHRPKDLDFMEQLAMYTAVQHQGWLPHRCVHAFDDWERRFRPRRKKSAKDRITYGEVQIQQIVDYINEQIDERRPNERYHWKKFEGVNDKMVEELRRCDVIGPNQTQQESGSSIIHSQPESTFHGSAADYPREFREPGGVTVNLPPAPTRHETVRESEQTQLAPNRPTAFGLSSNQIFRKGQSYDETVGEEDRRYEGADPRPSRRPAAAGAAFDTGESAPSPPRRRPAAAGAAFDKGESTKGSSGKKTGSQSTKSTSTSRRMRVDDLLNPANPAVDEPAKGRKKPDPRKPRDSDSPKDNTRGPDNYRQRDDRR